MFSKILIANRGEIAVRVAQTCREMGITSVAVYSTADARSLHVRRADEVYCIGPPNPRDSYLNVDSILQAALQSGAQAVHPGYGFLAESAAFAQAVVDAGLVWIGPPPSVISLLGDKVAAKHAAGEAGVPTVPDYRGPDLTLERLASEARRIGYPVMLKAAAGGGGRGMRAVVSSAELAPAVEAARREAGSAFGDDRIFIEQLLQQPRHVEVQILVDARGHAVHLGERDCSLQRRHQKVMEEAPGPTITPTMRTAMGEAAIRLARATGYVNAGTVEFLWEDDAYYFLEVNTRIQVEHPVTEMVTGLDLVRLQIEIAAGIPLPLHQEDVRVRGHAVEARLYAEDPNESFLPQAGPVKVFRPPSGVGIRTDVGVAEGDEVSTFYDPMLAKIIVHAETRDRAVGRLRYALEQCGISGLPTNHAFLSWIVGQPALVEGDVDVHFIDREWDGAGHAEVPDAVYIAAALYRLMPSACGHPVDGRDLDPWHAGTAWRSAGMSRRLVFLHGAETRQVTASLSSDATWRVAIGDVENRVDDVRLTGGALSFRLNGARESATVDRTGHGWTVTRAGASFALEVPFLGGVRRGEGGGMSGASLVAPMPGTVVRVLVREGQAVEAHEPLVILEAMKMEHVIEAPSSGTIESILFHQGDMVPGGAAVVRMTS